MAAIIRQERQSDHRAVFALIEKAFKNEAYSDHREQFLVERLRTSGAFIPELSLVAETDHRVMGHILMTKIKILSETQLFDSLALARVTVLPEFQKRGIGGQLIEAAHKRAKALDYGSIVLVGHKDYYPGFGYSPAGRFGIELPFDVPPEYCMAIELTEDGLKGVSGTVEYPKAFGE